MLYEPDDVDMDLLVAEYVERGALEPVVDEDGTTSFLITEKCAEICPELYHAHLAMTEAGLIDMLEDGLVDFYLDDDLEPMYFLTEEGQRYAESLNKE